MSEQFAYWGETLTYETGSYNDARLNERAVEVPIARWFLSDAHYGNEWQQPLTLEVGNVLCHYDAGVPRRVVDLYERAIGVENVDVFDVHRRYDIIVAISTVEHVRWDEPNIGREWDGSVRAIEHLHGLLRPGGRMLITVPMGWNPYLDTAIMDGKIVPPSRQCTMVRDGALNAVHDTYGSISVDWVQTPELSHRRYAATTPWAESVWIGEWTKC